MVLHWRRCGRAGGCQIYGDVAQLGEHLPCKQGVDSSNLFISTTSCAGGKTRKERKEAERKVPRGTSGAEGEAGKKSCFEQDTLEGVEEIGAAGAEEAKIIGSRPLGNGLIAQVVRAHA